MSLTLDITAWHWWILALILLIFELMAPGAFFLWLAIGSGIVGVLSWFMPKLELVYHLILFSLFSIIAVFFYFRSQLNRQKTSTLNRRADQYIGRILLLDLPIENGQGKVQLGDTLWTVEGPDCKAGTRVKIISTQGPILYVEIYQEENKGTI